MPADRLSQSGPPSWPVPHLRPESAPTAESRAPAGPPPLSVEPAPWPKAPHLRQQDGGGAAPDALGSLPPWPPEPIWPAAPHLRDEPSEAGEAEQTPSAEPEPGLVAPQPRREARTPVPLLRPSRVARRLIGPAPPPAVLSRPTRAPSVRPDEATFRTADTAERPNQAASGPTVTTLRTGPPGLPGPAGPPARPPASTDPEGAVPTARLEGGPVRPHGQEPKPPLPRSGSPPPAGARPGP
jgi:hypothetical protein